MVVSGQFYAQNVLDPEKELQVPIGNEAVSGLATFA
jgi:hypothetical protein